MGIRRFWKNLPPVKRTERRVLREAEQRRLDKVNSIPVYDLAAKHCENARIVPNRAALLERMPSNGIVAELGADEGEFSATILKLNTPRKLHIVDVWGSDRYNDDKANAVADRFKSQIDENKVQITRKLSTDAVEDFQDGYFDWIYIDSDHGYSVTISELHAYARKIKRGGFIAGHDYTMGNWVKGFKYGVIEAVAEFCVKEDWTIAYLTANYHEGNSFALTRL
ncbi:class I SAM-dependent methyltransferase [Synechococcus sp. MU1644]|nr:class I SAM-dependent methyltransferase [Synechococcus sp. MU1644]